MRASLLFAAVAAAAFILAAPVAGAAVPASLNTPVCRWSNDTGGCDMGPGYLVAEYGATVGNNFTQVLMRGYAAELLCNQANASTACGANAAGCSWNDAETPACTANWEALNEPMAKSQLCPGSLAAASLLCSWHGSSEADCIPVDGVNCTWAQEACTAGDILAMTEEQLMDYSTKFSAFDVAVWGNCTNFLAYKAFVTACSGDGGQDVTEADCAAKGDACKWLGGHCQQTAVALLTGALGAAEAAPAVTAAKACVAAASQQTCAAAGGAPAEVDGALLAAVAAGDFAAAAATLADDSPAANSTTTTGGNSSLIITNVTAQRGGAGAVRAGAALFGAALLLTAAMLA
ncbi:hypothetical protein Rsub_07233 [Raphidocelis subcapitata]|uniref:Trypanosome variant surface glycoprotein C-terminal domain-containing protein n=1 Tax=Raphidocelis subcapitata TaxID=307507 RepID=A0A2V0P4B8_9CHLO|nr:hypothetical protein Rsub_07233 [Raphidocelis subcapitata]|eukprot:GBF94419.1 hypothetical protein Rsub_07233 [Raphidocelis subcapitata]